MAVTIEASFQQRERAAAAMLVDLALREDLGDFGDLTCQALVTTSEHAAVNVVARQPGVLSGSPIGRMVFATLGTGVTWTANKLDGDALRPGDVVATVTGPVPTLLIGERTMLNFLTHLSGIATLTRRFVDAIAGTRAAILDTRKTHAGFRLLEKYAVRCGGGVNHRMGLFDGVLIKDNHIAAWQGTPVPRSLGSDRDTTIAAAVRTARMKWPQVSIEVEVDSLDQLRDAMQGGPDIVLLDNMPPAILHEAVTLRDAYCTPAPGDSPGAKTRILLEASGGIVLDNVRAVAETGVERISIGALTHSAPALDLAFDWNAAL